MKESTQSGRPLVIVPIGLKHFFQPAASADNVVPFEEIREIDPTMPGLGEELESLLAGDYDDEPGEELTAESCVANESATRRNPPTLRLIMGGRR